MGATKNAKTKKKKEKGPRGKKARDKFVRDRQWGMDNGEDVDDNKTKGWKVNGLYSRFAGESTESLCRRYPKKMIREEEGDEFSEDGDLETAGGGEQYGTYASSPSSEEDEEKGGERRHALQSLLTNLKRSTTKRKRKIHGAGGSDMCKETSSTSEDEDVEDSANENDAEYIVFSEDNAGNDGEENEVSSSSESEEERKEEERERHTTLYDKHFASSDALPLEGVSAVGSSRLLVHASDHLHRRLLGAVDDGSGGVSSGKEKCSDWLELTPAIHRNLRSAANGGQKKRKCGIEKEAACVLRTSLESYADLLWSMETREVCFNSITSR
mmetsp:Transcript_18261/g.41656  ORF Transcript_18261/g.41656 Transcript_18261/m.41656 type:complete len:327 (-) Transcript_18261:1873-2853(-)